MYALTKLFLPRTKFSRSHGSVILRCEDRSKFSPPRSTSMPPTQVLGSTQNSTSYAPLLVNVNPGASKWATNLIGYDALQSYGSPSYYVQVMFSNNHGNVALPVTLNSSGGARLYPPPNPKTQRGKLFLQNLKTALFPPQGKFSFYRFHNNNP